MIEEGEARLHVKAAKTTRSLLAVVPKDDRGRTWSQAVRKEGEVFPIACSNELFNKAANQQGGPKHPLLLGNHFSLVSIRVSLEGSWFHDSLVVHQLVTFVNRKGVQFMGFSVPHDLMGFDDLGLTWFLLRLLDFIQDVLTHDVVIQLGFAFAVQAETPHFAFHLTKLGLVAIILGTARHEFHNVIVGVQFTCKLAEVIAQDWVRVLLVCPVHDGVRVVVQDTFPQQLKGFIEPELGPTGCETGHKNVEVG